jgi:hypothetical protein
MASNGAMHKCFVPGVAKLKEPFSIHREFKERNLEIRCFVPDLAEFLAGWSLFRILPSARLTMSDHQPFLFEQFAHQNALATRTPT